VIHDDRLDARPRAPVWRVVGIAARGAAFAGLVVIRQGMNTRTWFGVIAAVLVAAAGCKKETKNTNTTAGSGSNAGSVAGSAGSGSSATPVDPATPPPASFATDAPADTVGMIGFVGGARPDSAAITAALAALAGEDGRDMLARTETKKIIADCVVPLTGVIDRVTLILRGPDVDDDRVVIKATGKGLRGAFEACLNGVVAIDGGKMTIEADGAFTRYKWGGDAIFAAWTGTDAVAVAPDRAFLESTLAAKDGVKGTPFGSILAKVDTGSPMWFALSGAAFPKEAGLEAAHGQAGGAEGTASATFVDDKHAKQAAEAVEEVAGDTITVDGKGKELAGKGRLGNVIPRLLDPDAKTPRPALDDKHVAALVGAGPMVMAFFLLAGDSGSPREEGGAPAAVPVEEKPAVVAPPK
jgi:hypothetical protein